MNYSRKDLEEKIELVTGTEVRQKNRVVLYFATLALFLVIGFAVVGASVAAGAVTEIIENTPSINTINSIKPLANKSIIYASDGSIMQELVMSGSNRVSVSYDDLPKDLVNAYVAIEDARFFDHEGVDIKGIFRAIFVGLSSGNLSEGASTITQQLIKNNVFNGGMEKNFGDRIERKLQEQALALNVEKTLSKETIMEYYLNTINLGSNCLGVQVASRRYFGKDVSELDLAECAVLAAIAQNPSRFNPIKNPDKNQGRRLIVLRYMLKDGYISEEEYEEAISEDVYKRIQTVSAETDANGQHAFSWFTDAVFEDVLEKLQTELNYTDTQAYNMLYSGGLRIHTTMDPKIQAIVDEEVNNDENYKVPNEDGTVTDYYEYALTYRLTLELPGGETYYYDQESMKTYFRDELQDNSFRLVFPTESDMKAAVSKFRKYLIDTTGGHIVSEQITSTVQPQTSVIIIDQSTGHVKAVSGGRGDKDAYGSLVLNRATDSPRQPGSTFKTLVSYAPAIDTRGDTLATTYYDAPLTVGEKSISNWWGPDYMGYANIRFGLMASMNVLAVKCFRDTVTESAAFDYAKDFGITTLVADDRSVSMALGGLTYGATNLEMTAAYATIANDGRYVTPIFWTKITDADGNLILENKQETQRVLKSSSAKLLTSALESTVDPPFVIWPEYGLSATNTACKVPGVPVAGKSGTTTDANDIWFIGYSGYYTCGIWSGYDFSRSFGKSPGYHKDIWQHIMARIHEGLEEKPFDYGTLEKALICSKSGLLARSGICDACGDPNCHIYEEYFAPGTAPTEYCNRHAVYSVCSASGKLADEFCPEDTLVRKVYLSIDEDDDDGQATDDTKYVIPAEVAGSRCDVHTSAATEPSSSETETSSSETEPSSDPESSGSSDATAPSESEPSSAAEPETTVETQPAEE